MSGEDEEQPARSSAIAAVSAEILQVIDADGELT